MSDRHNTPSSTGQQSDFDAWYETYPDETPYMDGMRDAFEAGKRAAQQPPATTSARYCPDCGHLKSFHDDTEGCLHHDDAHPEFTQCSCITKFTSPVRESDLGAALREALDTLVNFFDGNFTGGAEFLNPPSAAYFDEAMKRARQALEGLAQQPQVSFSERALQKHKFVYEGYAARCYCGWCGEVHVGYSNAWDSWAKHLLDTVQRQAQEPQGVRLSDVLDILDALIPEDADVSHPCHVAYQQVALLAQEHLNPAPAAKEGK